MVFIPRWEKYKDKKPSGLVEVNYAHELSVGIHEYAYFTDSEVYYPVQDVGTSPTSFYSKNPDFYTSSLECDPLFAGAGVNLYRTLIGNGVVTSDAAQYNALLSFNYWASGSTNSGVKIEYGGDNSIYGVVFKNNAASTSSIAIQLDSSLNVSLEWRTGYVKLTCNGSSIGSNNSNLPFSSYPFEKLSLGTSGKTFVKWGAIYSRLLSPDEQNQLWENPYQILKPRKTFFVLTQSSGVTASVTGTSASLSAGTLSASITEQLTGAGLMATAGSSVSAIDHSLSGESIALAQGLVQGIIEALLTGQTLTGQSGLLQSAINQALTGQLISAEADTVTSTAAYSLTGQPISSDLDNITNAIDQALTGQSATTNISALSEAIAHSLTGQSINMVAGFVELIGNVVRGLTGEPLSVAQTTLTYDLTQNLLGGSVTTSSGVVEVSVNQGLTGSVIALSIGDLALQGQTARQLVGALISATSGSVQSAIEASLSGQAIALTQATIESAVSSLLTGQTITIEQGSSSVTLEKTLAGETIISGQGTIVFDSLDKSATLTGLQIQTSAGIVLVDGVRDTRLVNVIAMGNGGYVVVLDASTKVIIQDNGNKVIN